MQKTLSLFLLPISLFWGGCYDTLNHKQYLLIQKPSENEFDEIRKKLESAFEPIIQKYALVNSKDDAKANGVLLYYKTKNNFPIILGAKKTNKGVTIDVMQFHPGSGEIENYTKIVDEIVKTLEQLDSYTYIELGYTSQIE